jgi:hypothetical protein
MAKGFFLVLLDTASLTYLGKKNEDIQSVRQGGDKVCVFVWVLQERKECRNLSRPAPQRQFVDVFSPSINGDVVWQKASRPFYFE